MYIDGEFRISDLEFRIVVYLKPGPGVLISASAEQTTHSSQFTAIIPQVGFATRIKEAPLMRPAGAGSASIL
jgi:hypothetical protein